MKYKVYFENGTIEEFDQVDEISHTEYRLSIGSNDYNVLIDEVKKIDLIREPDDKLGCTIDNMAIGSEPHKVDHILKSFKDENKKLYFDNTPWLSKYMDEIAKRAIIEQEKQLLDIIFSIYNNAYDSYDDYLESSKKLFIEDKNNIFYSYIPILSEELFNYIKRKK